MRKENRMMMFHRPIPGVNNKQEHQAFGTTTRSASYAISWTTPKKFAA